MHLIRYGTDQTDAVNGDFYENGICFGFFYFKSPFLYKSDKKSIPGNQNDIFITTPNSAVCFEANQQESFCYDYFLAYLTQEEYELFERLNIPLLQSISTDQSNYLHFFLYSYKKEKMHTEFTSSIIIDSYFKIMLAQIGRECLSVDRKISSHEIMLKAQHKILAELDTPWTLKSMSELTQYSETRFSELYQKYFGTSPKAQLTHHRIGFARILLTTTNLSVKEIGIRCGIFDQYFFSRIFTKKVGVSPLTYRKQNKKN